MKRHIRIILMIIVLSASYFPTMAAEPDFNQLESVLETFSDSRKTRDLKEHGTAQSKESFTKTLETQVYQPVDDAVIKHLEKMPEYEGKRIVTHDFRTPGQNGISVNTDRDVRVLVEVELDRWIEVPVDKWEAVYYREFAQKTGMKVDTHTSPDALKEQAAKYRQLPTDRFHMEAGADYSDVGTIRVFEVNGQKKVLSAPNVVRTKKGFTRLKDPEGLARMYLEKADEQYRQAKEIEQRINKGGLSQEEVKALHDQCEMHEIEGTVQLKKGVESLEALRAGYEKQGYDVGRLPETFQKAITEIKKVNGTSRTDIKKLKADISALEPDVYKQLGDVNKRVSGQIESLKIAKKKSSTFKRPDLSLAKAGQGAGMVGDLLSIKEALDKAKQGNHLFINFDQKDSHSATALKTIALAAIELSPIPVIDAMERGWQVDDEEKDYIKNMMARGEYGDWKTHPVTSMARVSTKMIYRTVSSMTLDPLLSGKTAVEEGAATVTDIGNNFIADFSRQQSNKLQSEKLHDFIQRSEAFDLGGLSIAVNNGMYSGQVRPGDEISFITDKNETWTSDFFLRWELITPEGKTIKIKKSSASEEKAEELSFKVPALAFGEYKVMLRSFETSSGLQADFTGISFMMNEKTELGEIIATLGSYEGEPVNGEVTAGDVVAFHADKTGNWNSEYEVEWLVDGERYRKKPANEEDSNRFILKTEDLNTGNRRIAVRIFNTADNTLIVAHQAYDLKIIQDRVELAPFTVKGFIEKEIMIPLGNDLIQNADILRFTAQLKPVKSREPVVTTLFWQVYDHNGTPLEGLSKQETLTEVHPEKDYTFRFRPEKFSSGTYVVALTHYLVADPDNRVQARAEFSLKDKIEINRALITDNQHNMTPKSVFHPGEPLLFYVYYGLDQSIKQVVITLSARKKTGRVIDSVTVKRPKQGEQPPFRIGFTIPDGSVTSGEEGVFTAEITDHAGLTRRVSREFKVVDYRAEVKLPRTLKSGNGGMFAINLPQGFKPPYQVSLNPGTGLTLGYAPGQLKGTVTAIATGRDLTAALDVKVIDANGRVAQGRGTVTVKANKPTLPINEMASAIEDAIENDDVLKGRQLLEAGLPIEIRLYDDMTPLIYAAEYGAEKLLALFLTSGADPDARDAGRNTALYHAAGLQYVPESLGIPDEGIAFANAKRAISGRMTALLIQNGANPNLSGSEPPLHRAAFNMNAPAVEQLLKGGAHAGVKVPCFIENLPLTAREYMERHCGASCLKQTYDFDLNLQRYYLQQFNRVKALLK
ncbi:MAG: hypothetical protein JW773_06200 [Desulfuromonadales bacterium]|nr:hypothetical protein [Desulfuromonadales bacterium]